MAATVNIKRWTGSTGSSGHIITSINTVANACDQHQTNAATSVWPILIPSTGTNYSYWVSTKLATGATGPAGTINNLRWYGDGSADWKTGVGCKVATAPPEFVYYRDATGVQGESGTELTTENHAGIEAEPVDFTTYTAAAPLSLDGSTTEADTDFGSWVIYQLSVGTTATPGTTAKETFTWIYDET